MPYGFDSPDECRLGESGAFLNRQDQTAVTHWWLKFSERANTPNWDIASTAVIGGRTGLLLVEAKAHANEFGERGHGAKNAANSKTIGAAIKQASKALNSVTLTGWNLSRDRCYQLCNRFAWAWKLASLDIPVVLVYLGFLEGSDVIDLGSPFYEHGDWRAAVQEHASGLVPPVAWEQPLDVNGSPLIALISSAHVDLDGNVRRITSSHQAPARPVHPRVRKHSS